MSVQICEKPKPPLSIMYDTSLPGSPGLMMMACNFLFGIYNELLQPANTLDEHLQYTVCSAFQLSYLELSGHSVSTDCSKPSVINAFLQFY